MSFTSISRALVTPLAAAAALAAFSSASFTSMTTANAAMLSRSPQSIECSRQADAKGLHGKERARFRAECKHNAKAMRSTTTPKGTAPPAASQH